MEIEVFNSAQKALSCLTRDWPGIVVTDIMMPGMDGPQTLTELRKLSCMKGVPIVFMTAKAQTQEVAAYRDLGAAGVIIKPFDPMTLSDQIREIWEHKHA